MIPILIHEATLTFDVDKELRETADSVELAFDKVCLLVYKKYLDRNEIREIYGVMIVKTWKACRFDIEKQQESNKRFAFYFNEIGKEFNKIIKDSETQIS